MLIPVVPTYYPEPEQGVRANHGGGHRHGEENEARDAQ